MEMTMYAAAEKKPPPIPKRAYTLNESKFHICTTQRVPSAITTSPGIASLGSFSFRKIGERIHMKKAANCERICESPKVIPSMERK